MKFFATMIFALLAAWCGSGAFEAFYDHHSLAGWCWLAGVLVCFALACWMGCDEDSNTIDY